MPESDSERQQKLRSILEELDEDERELFSKVLQAEQQKIHMSIPRNINDDLWKVLTETIR